jgi:hypothetical protein
MTTSIEMQASSAEIATFHPLDPLGLDEIRLATGIAVVVALLFGDWNDLAVVDEINHFLAYEIDNGYQPFYRVRVAVVLGLFSRLANSLILLRCRNGGR